VTATKPLGTYGNAVGTVTPADHKAAQSGLIAKTSGNAVRAGLFWGGTANIITAKPNMSYDVAQFTAALSRGATSGTVLLANDGTLNVATTAAPGSNSRIDIIYVWAREYALDGVDSNPVIGVAQGNAAAVPVAPSLAAFPGAIEIGRATVGAGITATTSATITQTAPFTAVDGGRIPFRTTTERDAGSYQEGQLGWLIDSNRLQAFNGTTWDDLVPNAGSTLLAHQAFSGNAITIDTAITGGNLFSADHLSYDVIVELDTTSTATGISAAMRASGTDYSTGNHVARRYEQTGATPSYTNSTTDTIMRVGRANGTGGGFARFTIGGPQAAQYTHFAGTSHDAQISGSYWGNIPNTNVFTGLKIKLDGAVTGTGFVTVYGMRKS